MTDRAAYRAFAHDAGKPARLRRSYDSGLDLLRILAMAIVTLQHSLTVIEHYEWTQLGDSGTSIGQFGVAIFCAAAGWFALADHDQPGRWLIARLMKIYPAYWLATLFAFGLALMMARPVTLGLFSSQMAGTGFFTHGWDLVNVVSWFISLILLCYVLAAAARITAYPAMIMSVFGLGAALLMAFEIEVSLSRHVLVFAAAAIAKASDRPGRLIGIAALLLPLVLVQPSFIYAVFALPMLWLFQDRIDIESEVVPVLAGYTYEFFLLHGIFLAGAVKLTSSAPLAIALGIGCTVPAAVLLKRVADRLSAAANLGRLAS